MATPHIATKLSSNPAVVNRSHTVIRQRLTAMAAATLFTLDQARTMAFAVLMLLQLLERPL
jgi:hypothetical protein